MPGAVLISGVILMSKTRQSLCFCGADIRDGEEEGHCKQMSGGCECNEKEYNWIRG